MASAMGRSLLVANLKTILLSYCMAHLSMESFHKYGSQYIHATLYCLNALATDMSTDETFTSQSGVPSDSQTPSTNSFPSLSLQPTKPVESSYKLPSNPMAI